MKKHLYLALACIILIAVLCACGNSTKSSAVESNSEEVESVKESAGQSSENDDDTSISTDGSNTEKETAGNPDASMEETMKEEMNSTDYDFKKFHWGDSQEYVEKNEGTPEYTGDTSGVKANYIAYKTSVAGKDAVLAYYFCDQGLFQTRYILTEEHSNENMFITDYEDIKEQLTKKYGLPILDNESWQDDSKKDYYKSKKGDALSYGYLKYMTWYSTDTTEISMSMSADNYDISTTISFSSKDIDAGEADYSDDF